MENIENVKQFIKSLNISIDNLEVSLTPILKKSLDELTIPATTPQERIKIYNNFVYVLVSSIYSYLKALGVDTDTHPIKKELARVKSYMGRYKALESGSVNSEKQKAADEAKAREFLSKTLGIKSADTYGDNATPGVSFQGTHTKFKDSESSEDDSHFRSKEPSLPPKPNMKATLPPKPSRQGKLPSKPSKKGKLPAKPSKSKSGKISKPSKKSK